MNKIFVVLFLSINVFAFGQDVSELKRYTTDKTALKRADIADFFVRETNFYLKNYDIVGAHYLVDYEVYKEQDKQNFAWSITTYKNRYNWGTIYAIIFNVSNSTFRLMFSNQSFNFEGKPSKMIITTNWSTMEGTKVISHIQDNLLNMFEETLLVRKMLGLPIRIPISDYYFFNFVEIGNPFF